MAKKKLRFEIVRNPNSEGEDIGEPDHVKREYYKNRVRDARSGNKEAARELIKEFVDCYEENRPQHYVIEQFVLEALDSICAGEDANKALGLTKPTAGRQSAGNDPLLIDKYQIIAARVELILRTNPGINVEDARLQIEKETNIKYGTIERAYPHDSKKLKFTGEHGHDFKELEYLDAKARAGQDAKNAVRNLSICELEILANTPLSDESESNDSIG